MSNSTPLEIKLYNTLKRIGREYMTPQRIERDADNAGLGYTEYLEMCYENLQLEAQRAIKGVRIRRPRP